MSSEHAGRSWDYSAFISYAHRDSGWARWLHRRLEGYRAPQGVVLPGGARRLGRVFLDRSELASSADLGDGIEAALAGSANLVVLCSVASAQSRWVDEEVRRFRAMGRGNRIFCLIVDGDPSKAPGEGGCFAPALREVDGRHVEPLGADARANADGRTDAFLKLVAGIGDLRFDQLKRREQVRRQRRLTLIAAAASALALVLAALTVAAVLARNEARRQAVAADKTADFLRSLFTEADPAQSMGHEITAREMLRRGAVRLRQSDQFSELAGEPQVRADMLITVAELELQLGDGEEAERTARLAFGTPGLLAYNRARAANVLAGAALTRSDYAGAGAILDGALPALPADERTLRAAMLRLRGQVRSQAGEYPAAERDLQEAHRLSLAPGVGDRAGALQALLSLALVENAAGEFDRARGHLLQVVKAHLDAGEPNHPQRLFALNELGTLAIKQGRRHEAEAAFRQALAGQRRVLGAHHPEVALSLSNLGRALVEDGRFAEARGSLHDARAIFLARSGPDLDTFASLDDSLGLAEAGLGHRAAAEAAFADGLRVARLHEMPKEVELLTDRAELRCGSGRAAEALADIAAARAALATFQLTGDWRAARIDAVEAACTPPSAQAAATLRRALVPISRRWGEDGLFALRARRALAR